MMNSAFVFVKPHAVTEATKALVKEQLAARGINIVTEGSLTGPEIDERMLIDNHYYAIASKATILKPPQLPVPADRFAEKFGVEWQAMLDAGKVYNAMDACAYLGVDAAGLDAIWGKTKKDGKMIKFGGGFYCGLIDCVEGKEPIYAFNGFFMQMRSKFVAPDASIYYFVVEWDESALSWGDFRGSVLGPTDPAEAPADSIRGMILAQWEALGLASEPNTGDNGVHASASPFEALAERNNWLGASFEQDSFGAALLGAGIPLATLQAWSKDPQVTFTENGESTTGSLFDALEDMNSSDCLAKSVAISATAGLKNSAFVFVKPHAVTEATKALVKEQLAARGINIVTEGSLTGPEIDERMLIDNHYYAIASKATILKPPQLPVPADRFAEKFGVEWQAMLDAGKVYNAMDACAYLGVDAAGLDAIWGKTKKDGKMIKFGGGFYCGLIDCVEGKEPIYAFNGFFMQMRSKFVAPDASIYYFVVEWDESALSWGDFRGSVLGPTDPAEAPADSIRGMILAQWEALGLASEPNTGDNGVHASASPSRRSRSATTGLARPSSRTPSAPRSSAPASRWPLCRRGPRTRRCRCRKAAMAPSSMRSRTSTAATAWPSLPSSPA